MRLLAKRLLKSTVTLDTERNFVERLKGKIGSEVYSKLVKMLNDIDNSLGIMKRFKELPKGDAWTAETDVITVQVLTMGAWPLSSKSVQINLRGGLSSGFELFKMFYIKAHPGRRLSLNPGLGFALVGFGRNENRKYTLEVSTVQMVILVLFNAKDSLNFEEIQSETNYPSELLMGALRGLVFEKMPILNTNVESDTYKLKDTFTVNDSFKSNNSRVKLPCFLPQYSVGEPESNKKLDKGCEIDKELAEGRNHEIDATIVRIIKRNKVLHHSTLIAEVTKELSSRFKAQPPTIKKRIEKLIEREYLGRSSDDHKVYIFL